MKHTYLLEEGKWIAKGVYSNEKGEIVQVEGQTITTHNEKSWINDGSMKILTSEPVEFFNRYEIKPFENGNEITIWKSFNPALGELNGIFIIVQDSIMSKYTSKDKQYNGFEYLKKVDDVTYENRGAAFKKDEKLSSWAVLLERIE